MIALALLASTLSVQAKEIVLERGREVSPLAGGEAYRYWTVEDTTLDSGDASFPRGADANLVAGKGKVILIHFRELARAVGENAKIESASLQLGLVQGAPKLAGVRWIKRPWTEGPIRTLGNVLRGSWVSDGATWKQRRFGGDDWALAGALGDADSEGIEGPSLAKVDDITVRIDGLADAMQRQLDRPNDMHGLVLLFDGDVEFLSSSATIDRPKLILKCSAGTPKSGADLGVVLIEASPNYPIMGEKTEPAVGEEISFTARIKNLGDAPSGAYDAQWIVDDVPRETISATEGLRPGQEATLRLAMPYAPNHDDHRARTIALKVFPKSGDTRRANNLLRVPQAGKTIEFVLEGEMPGAELWLQEQIRTINETVFRYSRFSFAPDGVRERLRIQRIGPGPATGTADVAISVKSLSAGFDAGLCRQILKGLGLVAFAPTGSRFSGMLGYGETRSDAIFTATTTMPPEPWFDPTSDQSKIESTDLLSMTDVAALNANQRFRGGPSDYVYDLPTVLLSLTDYGKKPMPGAELTITQVTNGQEGAPILQKTLESAAIALPIQPVGNPGQFPSGRKREANPFGDIDFAGGNGVLRLRVSRFGVERVSDLTLWQLLDAKARGGTPLVLERRMNLPRMPVQGLNLAPAKPFELEGKVGAMAEVDLGKEDTVGMVRLTGTLPARFEIFVRGAKGPQKLFFKEIDSAWRRANHNGECYGEPLNGRFVRIVNASGEAGKIERAEVFPVAGD